MATQRGKHSSQLGSFVQRRVLNAEEEDDLDTQCSNSDAASLVLQRYNSTCVWHVHVNCQPLTISGGTDYAKL